MAHRIDHHSEIAGLHPGNLEDKELTLAFQSGEKGAYQAIHDRHAQRVHRVCRRMLGPDDAQEAAQEAFLRIYQALGRFNGRYQLGPWITRIATNVCLDQLRARARRPSEPVPNEMLVLEEHAAEHESAPERFVIRNAESRRVRKVLATLPPMHRAAIVLRDFEGLTYEEVAVALQITDSQVKALIHRARQNFKRSWTGSLSALVPWRLIDRIKGWDSAARDHSVEVVTVAQSVGSCSTVLQSCGQYVGQHVATVVTAALVGTVAGTASHAAMRPAMPEETPRQSSPTSAQSGRQSEQKVLSQAVSPDPTKKNQYPNVPERPSRETEPVPPISEPTVYPTSAPTPEATPSPDPSASPESRPTEAPKQAPQPFLPAVGFDYGRPVSGRAPISHAATVSCTKDVLEQRLETVVEDDDSGATYPALLQLTWGPTAKLSLELTVQKNSEEIYYSGSGELMDGSYPSGERRLSFVGNYGTFNERAKTMDLPMEGSFTVGLALDCAALSVITESVVLGA